MYQTKVKGYLQKWHTTKDIVKDSTLGRGQHSKIGKWKETLTAAGVQIFKVRGYQLTVATIPADTDYEGLWLLHESKGSGSNYILFFDGGEYFEPSAAKIYLQNRFGIEIA